MNYGIILNVLGSILKIESLFMLPSLFISMYTGGMIEILFTYHSFNSYSRFLLKIK